MELEQIKKITEPRNEKEGEELILLKDVEDLKMSHHFSTGFGSLDDKLMGGLRGGNLMILSGYSGRGKTLYSLNLIKKFSNNGLPVLLFSYEESGSAIKWKMKNMGIDVEKVFCFVPKKLSSDRVDWLENKIKDGIANYLIEIVIIDNLDFLTAETGLNENDKWSMQSRIVGMLKRIAIENDIAIILNAHVGKDKEEKEPRMQDLYGSGDVYKLADFVVFIHRLREIPLGRTARIDMPFSNRSRIILDKNRWTGLMGSFDVEYREGEFYEV